MNTVNTANTGKNSGFTLIEILVTLGLIALVLALTWPKAATGERRAAQSAEALAAFLNAASSAADNRQIQVCVKQDGNSVVTVPEVQAAMPVDRNVTMTFTEACFDASGRPTAAIEASVSAGGKTLKVGSQGAYGQVEVQP